MQAEPRKKKPPIEGDGLQRLALRYVERYATTSAKLKVYLVRKVKERGWAGEEDAGAAMAALVARMSELGYVNDSQFAQARSASLLRRGYGERRLAVALQAAGVSEEDAAEAREIAREGAWRSALRFAARRRIGPYAAKELAREAKHKAMMAMMRAGHSADMARRIVNMAPGSPVDEDDSNFPLS